MATLLRKFFKPKWQHQNPQVRLGALAEISDSSILTRLVNEDSDAKVRLAALSKISDKNQLKDLRQHKDSAVQKQATQQLLSQLLRDKESLAGITDKEDLLLIAAQADSEQLRSEAINSIQDQQELINLALTSPSARLRHAATEKVEGQDNLQKILQAAKGKDKTQYRNVKNRLDVLAEEQKAIQKHNDLRLSKLESLQHLANSSYAPGYQARFQLIWNDLEKLLLDAEQSLIQQADSARKNCQALIDQHQAEEQAHLEKQQQQEKMSEEQIHTLDSLELSINQLQEGQIPEFSALDGLIQTQKLRWQQATQGFKAPAELTYRFDRAIKTLSALHKAIDGLNQNTDQLSELSAKDESPQNLSRLQKLINNINWPTDIPLPPALKSALETQEKLQGLAQSIKGQENELASTLKQQLKQLEQSLEEGQLKQSTNLAQQTQKTLQKLPHKGYTSQKNELQRLQGQLNSLRDWQGFATEPKQLELCEKMEALLQSELDAPELASTIKDLQHQWKDLKRSDKALWERFSSAADTAFEPCRVYYAEQKEIRQFNLQQREQICQQVKDFADNNDWENADWKGLRILLKQVREEWKKYSPVDRDSSKACEKAYYQVLDGLQAKLNQEYENNLQLKQELVNQAQALDSSEDTQAAINSAKSLQNQWQAIGLTSHKEHQVLWKAFREACDQLFNKRDSERKFRIEETEQSVQAAEYLVEEAEQLLQQENSQTAKTRLQEINQAFTEAELPRGALAQLSKRLEQVAEQLEQNIISQKLNSEKQAYQSLLSAASACDELEVAEQQDDEAVTALTEQVTSLKLAAKETLLQRLANLTSVTAADNAAEQMKKLCIQAEILANLDSPAEDQAERMQLQVARLQQGMGQANQSTIEQAQSLLTQWLSLSAIKPADKSVQQSRFVAALGQILPL